MILPPPEFAVIRTIPTATGRLRVLAAIVRSRDPREVFGQMRDLLPHIQLLSHEVFEVMDIDSWPPYEVEMLRTLDKMAQDSGWPGYVAA